MKALKNNSTFYTQHIVTAINNRYATSTEPSNAELMELYSFIGQCICEQGEKAFVVHLAQALTEQLPQIKGFSPRNLRRMRDFYRTYENQPEMMHKAQTLGWTQNAVILDCCETDEQRAFYLALTAENNLSKLALIKAIELSAFETALSTLSTQDTVAAVCPVVGDTATEEAVDATSTTETACGAFVPACEPSRQGHGLPDSKTQCDTSFCGDIPCKPPKPLDMENLQQKRSSQPASTEVMELLTRSINILYTAGCRLRHRPPKQPPPKWRHEFEISVQRIAFA